MIRRPLVCGRQVRVAGDPDDLYFASLQDGEEVGDNVLALFKHLLRGDGVVIDVGANIGLTTLALSALVPQGTVYAFEPIPQAASWLEANLRQNDATNVVVNRCAVGDKEGELMLWRNGEFLAGSMVVDNASAMLRSRVEEESWAFVNAPGTSVDRFVADRALTKVDLVKIDTEGHDLHVLRGAKQTLVDLHPAVLTEFASFPLTVHDQILPTDALGEVRDLFDRVFIVDPGGKLREIANDDDALAMLHENATRRPVLDLLCLDEGHPLLDRLDEFSSCDRLDARNQVERLQAEIEAMQNTVSWRVTRPLRAVRSLLNRPG